VQSKKGTFSTDRYLLLKTNDVQVLLVQQANSLLKAASLCGYVKERLLNALLRIPYLDVRVQCELRIEPEDYGKN
jgi:hypothetical protein